MQSRDTLRSRFSRRRPDLRSDPSNLFSSTYTRPNLPALIRPRISSSPGPPIELHRRGFREPECVFLLCRSLVYSVGTKTPCPGRFTPQDEYFIKTLCRLSGGDAVMTRSSGFFFFKRSEIPWFHTLAGFEIDDHDSS